MIRKFIYSFLECWLYDNTVKIVRINSWLPVLGPDGIEWPWLLVDRKWGREGSAPVWNRERIEWMLNGRKDSD